MYVCGLWKRTLSQFSHPHSFCLFWGSLCYVFSSLVLGGEPFAVPVGCKIWESNLWSSLKQKDCAGDWGDKSGQAATADAIAARRLCSLKGSS